MTDKCIMRVTHNILLLLLFPSPKSLIKIANRSGLGLLLYISLIQHEGRQ